MNDDGEAGANAARLRSLLSQRTVQAPFITYQSIAAELGLLPPATIQKVASALELLMHEDVLADRPMIAALVVSRTNALPRRGFFDLAVRLGRFPADPRQHHAAWEAECAAVLSQFSGGG